MIKNIIYLDVDKMYSMSSQVFEGVTEYIVNEKVRGTENSETQKGPIGSGKLLGDILRQQETVSERKVLIDHSFVLLERRLEEEGRVASLNANAENSNEPISLAVNTFVSVKAKVMFNDMSTIKETISNFNKVGRALTNITSHGELNKQKALLVEAKKPGGDPALRKALETQVRLLSDVENLQKATGLYQDPSFLADLATTLEYGYQDQLEVQMRVGDKILSANLKRDCLREKEDLLIRKYSRQTEVEFVLFGVVTQVQHAPNDGVSSVQDGARLKEAVISLIGLLTNLEATFTGRLQNEIIIDPIALYTEIN